MARTRTTGSPDQTNDIFRRPEIHHGKKRSMPSLLIGLLFLGTCLLISHLLQFVEVNATHSCRAPAN